MASLRSFVVILTVAALADCERSVPVKTNEGTTQARSPDVQRWSAPLKQPSMNSSAVISGVGEASTGSVATSYGSVMLSQTAGSGRARYELTVTVPPAANRQVAWALFTGSCSTASPPVVPINELQPLDLDAAGSTTQRGYLPVELDPRATYNLRVYAASRATDVNNVVLCARLAFSGKR